MRIGFIDTIPWDYKVQSAYQVPLGGSQSALCYLAEALARQGHEVFLFNQISKPEISCGVNCLPLKTVPDGLLNSLDALIIQNITGMGKEIKPILGEKTSLVLWTQHAHDQPAMQELQNSAERDVYDGIAFVSSWQRDYFYEYFGINPHRAAVLRNAISPAFYHLFPNSGSILAQKSQPPVLAYTSTPFRGLDILLEVFPRIRKAVPGTKLKVFSSMKVYQVSETDDEFKFGSLYRLCRETEGVEYIGSKPQPDLAEDLCSVTALAYPNTFAETSCIAVMEAMASGCWIVTSELGALPETTGGFAHLIPIGNDWEAYKDRFVEETIQVLRKSTSTDGEVHLQQQVNYVNSFCSWSVRASEWVQWLNFLIAERTLSDSQSLEFSGASIVENQQQAYYCLLQNHYDQAVKMYEQLIEAYPTLISNYWYLGLSLLLQSQEVDAISTWMMGMADASEEEVDLRTVALGQVLRAEADRREGIQDYSTASLIRQQLQ